jgi:hypothetical protein
MRAAELPADAAEAEVRFLEELRSRVAWQAEEAARLRLRAGTPAPSVDLLDANALELLVHAHPEAPRAAEWRAFLAELRYLADDRGRLPATLERLIRVVLADLLRS